MNNLTGAIKGKITAGNNKYTNQQEKKGIVIEGNKADNRCVISVLTRDGTTQVFYNVPVLYIPTDKSMISWFPENGEEVLVTEKIKSYVITGPIIDRPNTTTSYDYFSYGTDDADGNLQ